MSTKHKFEKNRHTKDLIVLKQVLMEFQRVEDTEKNFSNFKQGMKASGDFIHRFEKPLAHLIKG